MEGTSSGGKNDSKNAVDKKSENTSFPTFTSTPVPAAIPETVASLDSVEARSSNSDGSVIRTALPPVIEMNNSDVQTTATATTVPTRNTSSTNSTTVLPPIPTPSVPVPAALPPRPPAISTKVREKSDGSVGVALPPPVIGKRPISGKHNRTVSWGDQQRQQQQQLPGHLQQPPLQQQPAEDGSKSPPSNQFYPNFLGNQFSGYRPRSGSDADSSIYSPNGEMMDDSQRYSVEETITFSRGLPTPVSQRRFLAGTRQQTSVLNLVDVLRENPLETEAETFIIQAIEAKQATTSRHPNRQRLGTSTSIFSELSAREASVFTATNPSVDEEDQVSPTSGRPRSNTYDTNDEARNRPVGETEVNDNTTTASKGTEASIKPSLQRKASTGSASGMKKTAAASPAAKPKKRQSHHRRANTMEVTLAGLASALGAMHEHDDDRESRADKEQHSSYPEPPVIMIGGGAADGTKLSAGESLAQNANLIYRGNRKTDASPQKTQYHHHNQQQQQQQQQQQDQQPTEGGGLGSGTSAGDDSAANQRWGLIRNRISSTRRLMEANLHPDDSGHYQKKTDSIYPVGEGDETMGDGSTDMMEEGIPQKASQMSSQGSVSSANTGQQPPAGPSKLRPSSLEKQTGFSDGLTSNDYDDDDDKNGCCKWIPFCGRSNTMRDFRIFLKQRRTFFFSYMRFFLMFTLSFIGIAAILFYLADNPSVGRVDYEKTKANNGTLTNHLGETMDPTVASASWWILFLCVRQAIAFTMARFVQVIVIDFLCLSTRIMVQMFGNLVTLFIVQSRGWPFILFVWCVFDFALMYGSNQVAHHWAYWQDAVLLFTEVNPSGNVTTNYWNLTAITIGLVLSSLVAVKRLWLGLFLGRKTYGNYAEDLAKVMKKILCLCEVASLARQIKWETENLSFRSDRGIFSKHGITKETFDGIVQETADQYDDMDAQSRSSTRSLFRVDPSNDGSGLIVDPDDMDERTGALSHRQKMRINELLGAWEGPEQEMAVEENPSISAILQFRQSLSFIDSRYMFSLAWGDVSWRDRMVISSQEVFRRLLLRSPEADLLSFDILALTAVRKDDGEMDQEKLKDMIRLFRPDRDGNLSLLQFVKSVDTVYKEAKLLTASVENSEKIDRAFERTINVIFYVVFGCITLSQMGFDPLALFLSLSSIILAFAFMIGTASSKMFEGFLFILIRRPYDIGDRINVSHVDTNTSPDGSPGWIVKDVNLFYTTVIFGTTNERATLSNGSLASSRIINMARSTKATILVYNKFPTEVSFHKIQIFEDALRKFVKSRPREWATFVGFRATQVVADVGFIEYVTILQHREAWQNVGAVLTSKAQVASFCLELSKKLDMRYKSPPLPVDLTMTNSRTNVQDELVAPKIDSEADAAVAEELVSFFQMNK